MRDLKELSRDLWLLERGFGVATKQESAESFAVSKGNAGTEGK